MDNLQPYKYLNKLTNNNDIGIIAHELQQFYPDLVNGQKDDIEYQNVNYNGLIGILINEIQRLKSKAEYLETVILQKKNQDPNV